jgi:hypothetical protein
VAAKVGEGREEEEGEGGIEANTKDDGRDVTEEEEEGEATNEVESEEEEGEEGRAGGEEEGREVSGG